MAAYSFMIENGKDLIAKGTAGLERMAAKYPALAEKIRPAPDNSLQGNLNAATSQQSGDSIHAERKLNSRL